MGLFETFIVKVTCPYCKEELTDFQSKSFECEMNTYRIGERLLYCPIEKGVMKRAAYTRCETADKFVYIDIKIKNSRFIAAGKPVKEEQYHKEQMEKEKRWKKSKKYKEERKRWAKQMKWVKRITKGRRKRNVFRQLVSIRTKDKPDILIIDNKNRHMYYRFKKFKKNKILLEKINKI